MFAYQNPNFNQVFEPNDILTSSCAIRWQKSELLEAQDVDHDELPVFFIGNAYPSSVQLFAPDEKATKFTKNTMPKHLQQK